MEVAVTDDARNGLQGGEKIMSAVPDVVQRARASTAVQSRELTATRCRRSLKTDPRWVSEY